MARRLGWRPDEKDPRDLDFSGFALGSSNLPPKASLRQHLVAILNQSSSSSCVGFSTAGALWEAERAAGVVLDQPSPADIYFNARRMSGPVFFDNGTYIRDAMEAIRKLGVCPESLWPFSTNPLKLNRQPSFAARMAAHPRRGGEYRRIFDAGDARALAVKASICAGIQVVFGTQVGSKSFMNAAGLTVLGPPVSEPWAGGHAEFIDGYEDVDGGEDTLFDVVNSWGVLWGNVGTWRMTKEYLLWAYTQDIWACRGWEAMRS